VAPLHLFYSRPVAGRRLVSLCAAAAVAIAFAPAGAADARKPRANLDELSLKAPSGEKPAAALLAVRDVVVNRGSATAGRSAVGFFLSRDGRLDRGDTRLGSRTVKRLRPHRRSTGPTRLGLPVTAAAGTYRLLACADYLHRVRESSERDNCVAAPGRLEIKAALTQPEPDPTPTPTPDPPAPTAVTLASPADGSATNAADPAFSGAAAPGAFVTVTVLQAGAQVRSLQALPGDDGSWSVTAPGLDEGSYTASASQTDSFGRTQTSDSASFRVDRTAPVPALVHPASGSTTADTSPSADGTRGTADGDAVSVTLKLYSGATASGTPILTLPIDSPSASWSTEIETDLGPNTYTARIEQADSAANVGQSAPHTFEVDDTGPLVTLTDPAGGIRTSDTTPTFDGTAEDTTEVSVDIYAGTSATGTPTRTLTDTPDPGGDWSAALITPLAAGDYTARASQTDSVGNVGTSAPHTFTVDTTAPTVTVAHPTGFTGDTTPHFDGTAGTAQGDLAAITVDVYNGSATSGTAVQHLTTTASGATWGLTPAALAEGSYTAVVSQADSADNSATDSRSFTVDTTPPAVTVTSPAPGALTSDSTPTFDGSAGSAQGDQPQVTVNVYAGPTPSGTPVSSLSATGPSWSVTQPSTLSDGTYTVVAAQSDAAGNEGTSSPARTFTIDATGPAVTLTQPADSAITNDTTPGFTGTAEDTTEVRVKVYLGTSPTGTPTQTLTTTPGGGGNWSATPSSALPQGTYTAQAEQTDPANNVGMSTPHQFEVDTTQPTLTMAVGGSKTSVHVVADDSNFAGLTCTTDSQPATIDPATNTTHDAEGDVNVSGEGSHTVACTATDAATNSTSDSKTFTLDSTPPVVGLTSPAAGATTDDPTPTFSGAAGTASGDASSVTLRVYAGSGTGGTLVRTLAAPVSGSTWTVTDTTNLSEGTYTARAEQTDAGSNTGFSAAHTFTIGPATMLTAGDIGGCEDGNDAAGTAAILRAHPQGIVQTLGDNVYGNATYDDGTLADFENCYGPNWGTEKARTKPAVGNHEYNDPHAAGYFAYFGSVAGDPSEGWYSYDLGAWHVVVLNSNCSQVGGCGAGSDQETWLRADLQAHPAECTAAVWHHPRFTSDQFTGQATSTGPLWTALYDAHADLILNGHAHEYERFAPKNPTGTVVADGITEIVAGMGGESHSSFGTVQSGSQVRDNTHFGVLQLTLDQTSFSWSFLPVGGGASLDTGTANCRA
jgi:hypothetical protein